MTVICPVRACDDVFACTVKLTGSSPVRGIGVVIVIHGTALVAVQMHRSCVAPPHAVGMLCCTTTKLPEPAPADLPS